MPNLGTKAKKANKNLRAGAEIIWQESHSNMVPTYGLESLPRLTRLGSRYQSWWIFSKHEEIDRPTTRPTTVSICGNPVLSRYVSIQVGGYVGILTTKPTLQSFPLQIDEIQWVVGYR